MVSVKASLSRDVLTSHLGLVSDKILNVSVSSWSNMSQSRPSRSRLGSRAIASHRRFMQAGAVHTVAAVRAILTSMTFVA